MLPQADIERYGGKAAILNYVRDKLPDMPIKPYVVKAHDATIDSVVSDFDAMKKPVIVRSTSPHEYGDFEGIFDSVKDVYDVHDLRHAVEKVKESAVSDRAKLYAKQRKMEIDGSISVMVQEQSDSQYLGAMMRHPNNPDLILIGYHDNAGKYKNEYSRQFLMIKHKHFWNIIVFF